MREAILLILVLMTVFVITNNQSCGKRKTSSKITVNKRRRVGREAADYDEDYEDLYEQDRNMTTEMIVGGSTSARNAWPWMAGLKKRQRIFCGATIITTKNILTAAHCVLRETANSFVVVVGGYSMNDGQSKGVKKVCRHASYSQNSYAHDIAMITLKDAITFVENKISAICLPPENLTLRKNEKATIIGWGTTSSGGPQSLYLREAIIELVSWTACSNAYGRRIFGSKITRQQICAGNGKTDTCQGDSGGPMMKYVNGVWCLIGITSFGEGCAYRDYPGVYTRVSSYRSWITDTISKCK